MCKRIKLLEGEDTKSTGLGYETVKDSGVAFMDAHADVGQTYRSARFWQLLGLDLP
jgi:hypothetical protein